MHSAVATNITTAVVVCRIDEAGVIE